VVLYVLVSVIRDSPIMIAHGGEQRTTVISGRAPESARRGSTLSPAPTMIKATYQAGPRSRSGTGENCQPIRPSARRSSLKKNHADRPCRCRGDRYDPVGRGESRYRGGTKHGACFDRAR